MESLPPTPSLLTVEPVTLTPYKEGLQRLVQEASFQPHPSLDGVEICPITDLTQVPAPIVALLDESDFSLTSFTIVRAQRIPYHEHPVGGEGDLYFGDANAQVLTWDAGKSPSAQTPLSYQNLVITKPGEAHAVVPIQKGSEEFHVFFSVKFKSTE